MYTEFVALSEDDMMRLRTDTAFVKETLKYHVVPEVLTTYDMNEGQVMETLYKAPLKAHVYQNVSSQHSLQQIYSSKDLDLFVVLRRVQQPGSYCDG